MPRVSTKSNWGKMLCLDCGRKTTAVGTICPPCRRARGIVGRQGRRSAADEVEAACRAVRVLIYARRAAAGQPLFDPPIWG